MATQNNESDYELLTEHLGYPPVSLLDDIINTVNVLADRALDSVERLLLSIPPQNLGFTNQQPQPQPQSKSRKANSQPQPAGGENASSPEEAAKREIESGTHQLETLLTASIDRNFDKLELYAMQNILTVQPRHLRPHMRLAHYAGLDFSALPPNDDEAAAVDADAAAGSSSSSDRPTVESVTALRRRLQASQKLNVALHREKARNDALLRNLRQVLGVDTTSIKKEEGADTAEQENPEQQQQQQQSSSSTFGFLSQGRAHLASIGSDTPITTTTQFTLSQLQAMRALSTSLRTLLPDLAASPDDDAKSRESSAGSKTWRRERAEYVEASSRKYLEKSGGLELGHQGRVRDGEYQGEGRALSKGEIEGLEAAVAMLGETSQGSKKKNNDDDEEAAAPADGEAMDES